MFVKLHIALSPNSKKAEQLFTFIKMISHTFFGAGSQTNFKQTLYY
jgi:hypothetical protein